MRFKDVSLGVAAVALIFGAGAYRASAASSVAAGAQGAQQSQSIAYKVGRLCQYLSMKSKDTTPDTEFTYEYERAIYDAAGVDYTNDTDEEIAAKVAAMWKRYRVNEQRCGPMDVPATGSPLRFAIYTSFDDFISDYLSLWKLDLNEIENGQTMLDFLDERISRSSGVIKENLERYRRGFVHAGAKRRSEL